jgi:opacity protein-like surface antigen
MIEQCRRLRRRAATIRTVKGFGFATLSVLGTLMLPSVANAGRVYVGAFGGFDHRPALQPAPARGGSSLKRNGYLAGGRLGWIALDRESGQFRLEAEVATRWNRGEQGVAARRRQRSFSGMINAYYDFGGREARVVPFIGAGMGVSELHSSSFSILAVPILVDPRFTRTTKTSVFGWQAMAGASVKLSSSARLVLEGRLQRLNRPKLDRSAVLVDSGERRGSSALLGVNFGL